MPQYRKNGAVKPLKTRFRPLSHKKAAYVHTNLSDNEFRTLQEIAIHGLGYTTDFSEHLPRYGKKKVKPSSFKIYAGASNPLEIVKLLAREKAAHDNHSSETHVGGGLLDAFNTIGGLAHSLLGNVPIPGVNLEQTIDKLEPEDVNQNITNQIDQAFTAANAEQGNGGGNTGEENQKMPSIDHAIDSISNSLQQQAQTEITEKATELAETVVQDVADQAVTVLEENASNWIAEILGGL